MTGESFCTASREAFFLALRNAARFGAVHGIGGLFVFVGKLFITCLGTMIGYSILTSDQYTDLLYSPIAPTVVKVG